jgi:hypothetical protein
MIPLITKAGGYILANRWTWYALGGVALAVAFLIYRHELIEVGKKLGGAEQKQATQQDINLAQEADSANTRLGIAQKNAEIATLERDTAKLKVEAESLRLKAEQLKGELAAGQRQVAATPDNQLKPAIRAKLGILPPSDPSDFNVPELRRVFEDVTDAPTLRSLVAQQQQQIAVQTTSSAKQDERITKLEEKDRIRADYEYRLESRYIEIYNLNPPKARVWWPCLKAWKCGVKKLPPLTPESLRNLLQKSETTQPR